MIPPVAPQYQYDRPPEYGGLLTVYPMVSFDQQYGLFHEVVVDQLSDLHRVDNWPHYNGDVWTIQLTARPGYYVTPEQMENYAIGPSDGPIW